MNEIKPTVLKIGGSVITNKKDELAAKTQEIDRLAGEIHDAGTSHLLIVHGGGSFGHPAAERYALKNGYKEESQKIGFSETHHFMTVLNGLVMDSFIMHGLPAVSVMPSSCIMTEKGIIKEFPEAPVKALLKLGFIPVFYGDAVFDTKLGFTVLSGDQLVAQLAIRFGAYRMIIGVDVDGLYDADPKLDKKARMFENLTLEDLKKLHTKLAEPTTGDVTGGMYGKTTELTSAVEMNIPVRIVNASEAGRVYKALLGEEVKGTTIRKE